MAGQADVLGERVRWYGTLYELPAQHDYAISDSSDEGAENSNDGEGDEGADEDAPLLGCGADPSSNASAPGVNSEYRISIPPENATALIPPHPVLGMARSAGTELPGRFSFHSAATNCSALLSRICCWNNDRGWDRIEPIKAAITLCGGVLTAVLA